MFRRASKFLVLALLWPLLALAVDGTWDFLAPVDGDLLQRQKWESQVVGPAVIGLDDKYMLDRLDHAPMSQFKDRAPWLTMEENRQGFYVLQNHPVASPALVKKYDPQNLGIGFCFGRATADDIELEDRGLAPDSKVKLWVVGTMRTPDGNKWQFHVATAARTMVPTPQGTVQKWMLRDTSGLFDGPVTSHEWFAKVKEMDAVGDLRLYITPTNRFSPIGDNSHYSLPDLLNPGYNGYFRDLLTDFALVGSRTKQLFGPLASDPRAVPIDPSMLCLRNNLLQTLINSHY